MSDVTNESVNRAPSVATRARSIFRSVPRSVLAAMMAAALLAGAWYLLSDDSEGDGATAQEQRTPALTVTTATPRSVIWPITITASGSIAAWQEASVGAQIGGYQIVEVRVNVGDQVRRGDVLARFDSALLRAEEAQLLANDEQAIADRDRALALQREGAISDQEVLKLVTAAKVSAALLASKRLQLRYTDVVAPDDGVISARSATLGAVPAPGEELFRLIRDGRLEWRGELTAAQLSSVNKGQSVELALPDGSTAFARVREIAPSLDERSRLGVIYADITPGSHARAGMFANGNIVVGTATALVVPAECVVIRDGRTYVVKLADEHETPAVTLQAVTLGRRRSDEVEIVSGITEADMLMKAGAGFLSEGDFVRIADTPVLQSSVVRDREVAL